MTPDLPLAPIGPADWYESDEDFILCDPEPECPPSP